MDVQDHADRWVMLVHRMPREPSTPRIAVWRKLRKYGVFQLADGVVILPASPRTREQFDWIAEEIVEAGGQAQVWTAAPTTVAQQEHMRAKLAADRAAEYDAITAAATAAFGGDDRDRLLRQLRRRFREIGRRDFFPTNRREVAEAALRALSHDITDTTAATAQEVRR